MPQENENWEEGSLEEGVIEIVLKSWEHYSEYISEEMLDYTSYFYRGQGDSEWNLTPSLDRIVKKPTSKRRRKHLQAFQYETRGRRGSNPANIVNENDWWALGQHHGLYTPLLDWTESPFVALYFAVCDAIKTGAESYAVFALDEESIQSKNKYINNTDDVKNVNSKKPTVDIVRPHSDENRRLVSQRGLFTRSPNNMTIEEWVMEYNPDDDNMELIKIIIPSENNEKCLRYLNKMNINHSTLFPDLMGASSYCNTKMTVKEY